MWNYFDENFDLSSMIPKKAMDEQPIISMLRWDEVARFKDHKALFFFFLGDKLMEVHLSEKVFELLLPCSRQKYSYQIWGEYRRFSDCVETWYDMLFLPGRFFSCSENDNRNFNNF